MTADPRATMRRVTAKLIPFLFILYIVAFLDRTNINFAQLQMQPDLGARIFTDGVFGQGKGIFFLGYFLFEVPSNLVLARVGARRWICRIMVTWGVIAMAMSLTRTPSAFYAFRFLLGAAEAGFFPGMILYLTYWYTTKERAHIIALFMTAIPISAVV